MQEDGNAESRSGVREGDVLAGKYRIEKVLGVGGMGVVVAGRHIQLDERVAVKFLLPEALANPEAVARFSREARAAVKIKSEHVARVTDVGNLENGAPYMVMEYLEGGDLSAWLAQRGALPVDQAVDFLLQACEALAEAHALGIVHRDLKPANLFVIRRADGVLSVKVLDFGISKVSSGEPGADMTRTSALMGSPLYMSPEQMQSTKDVDTRTDIWALGVVLYELITGVSPFQADTMPELVLKIVTSPAPTLRSKRADAPERLEAVLAKCLAKDRTQRYATIGDLAVALSEFGTKRARTSVERIAGVMRESGLSVGDRESPPSSATAERKSQTEASWGQTAGGKASARNTRVTTIATVVAVVLAGGLVIVLRRPAGLSPGTTVAPPSVAPVASVASVVPVAPVAPVAPTVVPVTTVKKRIASDPPGAAVVISGTEVGTTPYALALTGDETASVSLRLSGYEEATRTVGPGDPDEVRVRLERRAEPGQPAAPAVKKTGTVSRPKLAPR